MPPSPESLPPLPQLCLHELFRLQAKKCPEACAVVYSSAINPSVIFKATYQQLDLASDGLAAVLKKKGIDRDDPVGILMERSPEYALSYIAAHKAGGCYLPLETAYPASLLADVLADAEPKVVLTKREYLSRLPASQVAICLDFDEEDHVGASF